MALKSMTGYGKGSATADGVVVTVELSSVNRKQLDVNVALPRGLAVLDAAVQTLVRENFSRGRVSGSVRVDATGTRGGRVTVNAELAEQVVESLRSIAVKLALPDDLGATVLAQLPGLLVVEQDAPEADAVATLLDAATREALQELNRMRAAEGCALQKDMQARLVALEAMVKQISQLTSGVTEAYRTKLFARLEEAGLTDLASDERIVREIALFADRCDVSEELTRLNSHLDQAHALLKAVEPIGRTFDFLCQEFLREINTIGSKTSEIEITRRVVDFKAELERIREQVQNVE